MEELLQQPIKVYVKRNENGKIIEIKSEIFITNLNGWEYLTEGCGDKYAHAQIEFFEEE